ncbi:MAG: PGPGW domain-containing protein [Pseudomonadota bacterium]|nr:PGPGW domain-containing protein [Pseudomonadota bacterium]
MYEYRDQHAQRTTEGDNTQRNQRPQEQGLLISGLKQARRLIVLVVGGTVLLAGICMLILPGPGLIVIPLGLGILAIEFAWARRLLNKFKEKGKEVRNSFGGKK